MFLRLFEERDKAISNLIKLGDYIGRSIRENVILFSIDSTNEYVTYLTESNKVISGNYNFNSGINLKNIKVQDSSIFEDEQKFDLIVNSKIKLFIENIHHGEYSDADISFGDVLSLWEQRVKLSSLQNKLNEKCSKLASIENIIESKSFQNLIEVKPQLESFLKEDFEKIIKVPEIKNAVNLSHTVSKGFNLPKLTLEELQDNKEYSLSNDQDTSIYDMICRQELVKKELIESKKSFDLVWANNPSIKNLASLIFESDDVVVKALSEALKEVPYLALASKKQLFKTFSNSLANIDGFGVSDTDIQTYASRIFEYKKEVKDLFIQNINEKYGVNILTLQEPVSFKSLANTQVVIFEALSRLSPKGSILKNILSEMAKELKTKSGVECIDVNNFLVEMFVSVGYDQVLEEAVGMDRYKKVDFKRIVQDLSDITELINGLQDTVTNDAEYESDENVDQEAMAAAEEAPEEVPEEAPEGGPEEELPPEIEPETQEKVLKGLSDLEAMVGDIVKELQGEEEEEEAPEDINQEGVE